MGCSSSAQKKVSTEKSTTRHENSHQIDLSSYLKEEGVKDLEDPITSWEVHDVPKGYPPNMLLPPDRKLHEKHMKKLNKFLKRTEKLPSTLTDSVEEKRERSHFQVSVGISLWDVMSRLLAVISKERCTQRHMGRENAQLSSAVPSWHLYDPESGGFDRSNLFQESGIQQLTDFLFFIFSIFLVYTCLSASRDSVVCADRWPQNSIGFAKWVKEMHGTEKKLLDCCCVDRGLYVVRLHKCWVIGVFIIALSNALDSPLDWAIGLMPGNDWILDYVIPIVFSKAVWHKDHGNGCPVTIQFLNLWVSMDLPYMTWCLLLFFLWSKEGHTVGA